MDRHGPISPCATSPTTSLNNATQSNPGTTATTHCSTRHCFESVGIRTAEPNQQCDNPSVGLKILVVDDNLLNLRVIKQILHDKMKHWVDHTCLSFSSSGREALEYFGCQDSSSSESEHQQSNEVQSLFQTDRPSPQTVSGKAFDLIFLDVSMPGLSGIEVCQRLRAAYPDEDIHICAVTTDLAGWQIDLYRKCGMNGLIGKPFKTADLEYALRQCAAQRELLKGERQPDNKFYFRWSGSLTLYESVKVEPFSITEYDFNWSQPDYSGSSPRKISVVTDLCEIFRPRLERLDSLESGWSISTTTQSQDSEAISSSPLNSHESFRVSDARFPCRLDWLNVHYPSSSTSPKEFDSWTNINDHKLTRPPLRRVRSLVVFSSTHENSPRRFPHPDSEVLTFG